jgi:Leucine-rich repeat (LRR) protein
MHRAQRLASVGLALALAASAALAQGTGQGEDGVAIDLRQERFVTEEQLDARFEAVCRTPRLSVLYLTGTECTPKRVPFLSLARSLRELHIDRLNGPGVTDLVRTLALMPRLTVLEVNVSADAKSLVGLHELLHLEDLTISGLYDDGSAGPMFPPKLKRLTLVGATLESAAWSNLADVPLESLILVNMTLRDNVMRYLSAMTSLRRLDIPESILTPEAIEKLKRLRRLESLDISAPQEDTLETRGVSHGVLKTLAESLTELRELKIRFVQVSDFTCLKGFEKLTLLDARGVKLPIKSAAFTDFAKDAKNLEVLYLVDTASENDTFLFDGIRRAPKLKVLLVGQSRYGSAWGSSGLLMHLDGHPTLEGLRVMNLHQATNFVSAPGGAFRECPNLPQLSRLALEGCDIEESGLKAAAKLPRLETLMLRYCQWGNGQGLDALQEQATIKELSLQGTNLEGRTTEPLGTMKNLERLDLGGTSLTGEVLTHLQAVRTLRSLVLDQCEVVDRDLRAFEDFAPIDSLSLAKTSVTDRGVETLASLPGLKDLSLEGTSITTGSAERLSRMKQLRRLNLKETTLGKARELASLKEALPECRIEP